MLNPLNRLVAPQEGAARQENALHSIAALVEGYATQVQEAMETGDMAKVRTCFEMLIQKIRSELQTAGVSGNERETGAKKQE